MILTFPPNSVLRYTAVADGKEDTMIWLLIGFALLISGGSHR